MQGCPVFYYLQEFPQTHVHWVGDAIQPSYLSAPPSLPALNISIIRVFSNESALYIWWPKFWSFSFSISPSNENSRLISFRIDWFDFLAAQGILKSLLQHHNLKHPLFGAQPSSWSSSHSCTWLVNKNIALSIWTFVSEVMSLFLNTLSKFVIALLPRSKHLLILWLQSPSIVILEPNKIKSVTFSTPGSSVVITKVGRNNGQSKLHIFYFFMQNVWGYLPLRVPE